MFLPDELAAAHQKDLHAGLALGSRARHQIHVEPRLPHDVLFFGDPAHLHDPVANSRGRLEVEVLGGLRHLVLQARQQRILFALEEEHDLVDRPVVILFRLIADARCETTLDVVLQAGPFSASVDRFAAGPQRKDQADQVDQLAQAVGVRVRPEVARPVVAHEAREDDARKRLVGYL